MKHSFSIITYFLRPRRRNYRKRISHDAEEPQSHSAGRNNDNGSDAELAAHIYYTKKGNN